MDAAPAVAKPPSLIAHNGMTDWLNKLRKSWVVKNRLTLWAKFSFDTLTGRNKFLFYGRTFRATPRLTTEQSKTIMMPTAWFLDRGLAWQTTIAKALELRGHQPVFVPLDLHFPRRNALYFDDQDRGFATPYYNLYTNTLLRNFGFTIRRYSSFGSAANFSSYRHRANNLSFEQCQSFSYHNLPIGRIARNPLIHYFRCSTATRSEAILEAYRDFLAIGMVLTDTLETAFDQIKPNIVFTLNGAFLDSHLQLAIARERHIRTVTFEAGFMLNAIMLGIDEPIISFPMAKYLPPSYSRYHLNPVQDKQLQEYLNSRSQGKDCVFDYWGKPIFDHQKIRAELGLSPGIIPDILFTNLLWDSAMLDCDIAFPDQFAWINETILWYAEHPERTLLVRIHPAEVNPPHLASTDRVEDAIRRRWPLLPPNIILIPPSSAISSYPLTEISNLSLVYSSTAGLEAAIMGKPAVIAGQTHYRGQGFTHDIVRTADYFALLERPRLPAEKGNVISGARKYAYFFFFGFNIPFPLVQEQPTTQTGPAVAYAFSSTNLLMPGQDLSLDFIIDVILGQADYQSRLSQLIP